MRKIVFMMVLLTLSCLLYSQAPEGKYLGKQELKLNMAYVLYPAVQIEYEYLFSDATAIGAVGMVNFNDNTPKKSQFLGFYRWYFGKAPVSDFFMEYHLGLTHGYDDWGWEPEKTYTAFSTGIALGWKFVSHTGVVLDVFAGMGRLIGDNDYDFYERIGICVGKRF